MLGSLSSRVVLADLISAAIDGARARGQGRMWPHDLEGEIYRQLERALTAQDQRAAVLRTEIAEVLAETDALRAVLSGAIETGNWWLRNDVISAIDTLSGGYPQIWPSCSARATIRQRKCSGAWTGKAPSSAR